MKLKHIFSLLAGVLLMFAACSPDDYSMGGAQYDSDDLVEGKAYTVTVDGNKVTLKSLITGCQPLWITTSGRSQEEELTLELPFAGTYEVTFGADTRSGAVYGEPYTFTLAQNDFSLLSDEKWFYLTDVDYKGGDIPDEETIKAGLSKKWYPIDADYSKKLGSYRDGPIAFLTPYDPDNDGEGYTDSEKENLVYKDVLFGQDNWSPNWGPAMSYWGTGSTDPYLDSYMEFSLDAANGCVATMYRGENGTKTEKRWEDGVACASTGTTLNGKFNLGLTDATKPVISFSDCYVMHPASYDETCANYTQELQILELTPYYLAIVCKRTNSEGNWYVLFNFVSEEVIKTEGECIPSDPVLDTALKPVLPEFPNLATQLYTADINGVTFVGNELTYLIDEDAPYDVLSWNGAYKDANGNKTGKWESTINESYGQLWAPECGDEIGDFELTLGHKTEANINDNNKNPKTYMTWSDGTNSGVFFIDDKGQTISFTDVCEADENTGKIPEDFKPTDISFINATNGTRTIAVAGSELQVLAIDPDGGTLQIGVPDETSKDEDGNYTRYFVVNLKQKAIGGGTTGPTVVPLESDYSEHTWTENGAIRLAFWSYGASGSGIFSDVSTVKLKNKQTITVTFKLKPGVITWSQTPKCALIDNNIKTTWEQGCYDLSDAVTVNVDGETTVSLTNNTGSTQTFSSTCLDLSIQFEGYGEGDYTNAFESVSCVIE